MKNIIFFLTFALSFFNEAHSAELTESNKAAIIKAVKENLIDPESANFKFVHSSPNEKNVYCGLVNSKNRFGGYTGFTVYQVMILSPDSAYMLTIGTGSSDSVDTQVAVQSCAENGFEF